MQDRRLSQCFLQGQKGSFLLLSPFELKALPRQVSERLGNRREAPDKPPVEVCQTQERLDIAHAGGLRPLRYGVYLVHSNLHPLTRHYMAQEQDRWQKQGTFLMLVVPPLSTQASKHLRNMLPVLLGSLGINQNVIHIHQDTLIQ